MTNISKMLPAMGFVIAAALVALTSAFKEVPPALHPFIYNPPSGSTPYSVGNVENTAHWSYDATNGTCDVGSDEACRIYVSDNYVDPTGTGSYNLKEGFSISADESSSNIAYVDGTSDGSSSSFYANKPQ